MTDKIKVEGMNELLAKLKSIEQLDGMMGVMNSAAIYVKGKIRAYPPAGPGNQPRATGKWYERGYGWRWAGGGEKTSEMLGRSWAHKAGTRGQGFYAEVGTNVSYAEKVQGPNQDGKFKKIGWTTTETVADRETERVNSFVKKQVDKILAR